MGCCQGCVPPKRTPTCHTTCKEYIAEKEQATKDKETLRKQKYLTNQLNDFAITSRRKH